MDEFQQLSDSVDGKPDWHKAVFFQIIQTNRSMDMAELRKNVDILEAMTSPYVDDKFNEDKEEAFKDFVKELKKFAGDLPKETIYSLEWINIKALYSAIMKMLYRRKLLPQFELKEKEIGVDYGSDKGPRSA